MADIKGDPSKQPLECNDGSTSCPNLKEAGGGMEGEWYHCHTCGESFYLDYDEMR